MNAGEEWYVQARDIACIDAGDEHDILEVYGDEDFELFRLCEPEPDGARLGHLHRSPETTQPHPSGEAGPAWVSRLNEAGSLRAV